MPKLSDFTGNSNALGAANAVVGVGFLGVFGTGRYQVFYSSGTFNPQITAPHRVRVIGGGGGGQTAGPGGSGGNGGGGGGNGGNGAGGGSAITSGAGGNGGVGRRV